MSRGARGGRDRKTIVTTKFCCCCSLFRLTLLPEFSWETVKGDKYKECYLGHTLHTQRPTFNNPKPNAGWYASTEKSGGEANRDEIQAMKALEEELMQQALYKSLPFFPSVIPSCLTTLS